jgi:hypothetical protein
MGGICDDSPFNNIPSNYRGLGGVARRIRRQMAHDIYPASGDVLYGREVGAGTGKWVISGNERRRVVH